ncbi:hypothetical protein [Fusibacter sp. 3D3]|uniref:hypothetical protein n=1 Tax=Fusibacter sp. 3D3 TaxID=1048380 RepID=UPI0008571499|nr:hypothetical protein [Fusibacter sp. 3D3]GAU79760.1 hypothetical protein F3D3_4425 [Fusibacter sp. 3D3]
MKNIELLASAGSIESLNAAINAGEYCVVGGVLEGHDHCGHCSNQTFALEDEMKEIQ